MTEGGTTRRAVITGLGAVSPLGVGADALINRWSAGETGIIDGDASCRDFDPLDFLSRKESRRADRFTQLALAASDEALDQAGWVGHSSGPAGSGPSGLPYDPRHIGCVIGTGIGGIGSLQEQSAVLREKGAKAVSPLAVPLMMANEGSAAVAMRHGIHGESFGVVSACAAGSHAIGTAVRMIRTGAAEAVVTGGSESAMTEVAIAAFGSMGATSPTGISRPFDARRDGFVMGEGAGVLVLEEGEAAEARGATVLGEIIGYGATSDAHHLTAPDPAGTQSARAIGIAVADAGITPERIDYVNAHGTSTPLNDRSETDALKIAFGEAAGGVPVSSTKSVIGHLMGAAGAVEAVATTCALAKRIAPPTVGLEEFEAGLDLDYVPGKSRALTGHQGEERLYAISNSFGFGGHNAVLCIASP